jgi:hypothetical protein
MKRVGVGNTFAESGPYLEVIDKYGLSARHIAGAVNAVLKRVGRASPPVKARAAPASMGAKRSMKGRAKPGAAARRSKAKTTPRRTS